MSSVSRPAHGPALRVFISYTGEDLRRFAEVVSSVVRQLEWVPVDHHNWVASGHPTVEGCLGMVESCDLLVVIVAHRYGWVPRIEEGGDGERSITWLEVRHARGLGISVLPYLLDEDAPWAPTQIEALLNPEAGARLLLFKAELKKTLAGFFANSGQLATDVAIAMQKAAKPRLRALEQARELDVRAGHQADNRPDAVIPWSPYLDASLTVGERLQLPLPKRILAIDSAGFRTAAVFGALGQIERILQVRYGDTDFRLSSFFDLMGGTGEGATIGSLLALGMDVATARDHCRDLVKSVLAKPAAMLAVWVRSHPPRPSRSTSSIRTGPTRS